MRVLLAVPIPVPGESNYFSPNRVLVYLLWMVVGVHHCPLLRPMATWNASGYWWITVQT